MSDFRYLLTNQFFDTGLTLTATTSDADFPVTNLNKHSRSFVWRSTSNASQRIVLDLGSAKAMDSFAIFFDLVNNIQLTSLVTLRLEANTSDSWGAPPLSQVLTVNTDFKSAAHFFSSTETYQFWSIFIDDPTNTDSFVQLDSVFLSLKEPVTQLPEVGFTSTIKDQSKARNNAFGHEYWDIYPQRKSLAWAYKALNETDRQALKTIFRTAGKHEPLVIAFDTTEGIFGDVEEFMIYGRFNKDWRDRHVFLSFFDESFQVIEVV